MAIKYLKADALPALPGGPGRKCSRGRAVQEGRRGAVRALAVRQGRRARRAAGQAVTQGIRVPADRDLPEVRLRDGGRSRKARRAKTAIPHETVAVDAVNEAPAQVIFGLRPCDARGFVQMDQVFGGYGGFYFDPLYNARREATTLLAVTCARARAPPASAPPSAAARPAAKAWTRCSPRWRAGSWWSRSPRRARRPLAAAGAAAAPTPPTPRPPRPTRSSWPPTTKVDVPFDLDGIRDNLHDNIAGAAVARPGHALHQLRHLHLRVPQLLLLQHQRLASWRPTATATAAGTTASTRSTPRRPRATTRGRKKSNRFRNRFSHKFWYYPDKYDSLLCSGCGRCIMHCPTRIDIREVIRVMGSPTGRGRAVSGRLLAQAAHAAQATARPKGRRRGWLTTARPASPSPTWSPARAPRERASWPATPTCPRSRPSSRSSRRPPTSRPSA